LNDNVRAIAGNLSYSVSNPPGSSPNSLETKPDSRNSSSGRERLKKICIWLECKLTTF